MRSVRFSPAACRDVYEIWEYVARDRVNAADRLIERILTDAALLSEVPGMGHVRADVDDTRYRFWRVKSFLIVYRYDDAELTIVRVLHGARDVRRQLEPGDEA